MYLFYTFVHNYISFYSKTKALMQISLIFRYVYSAVKVKQKAYDYVFFFLNHQSYESIVVNVALRTSLHII